jgi:hypothetical protein
VDPAERRRGLIAFDGPGLVHAVYADARARAGWAELVTVRDQATAESLGRILGPAGAAVLRRAIDAADPAGRPR